MIAYDFDGVFVPDCDHIDIAGLDQTEFYTKIVAAMRPIFVPQQQYIVITARHSDYTVVTMQWFQRHLAPNLPHTLYHSNVNLEEPWLYKAEIINQLKLPVYVESSLHTVLKLQQLTAAEIIWFPQTVQQHLEAKYGNRL